MAGYGSLLTVMLLTNNVMPNFGAPATNDEVPMNPAQMGIRANYIGENVNFGAGPSDQGKIMNNVVYNGGSSWKDPNSRGYSTWTTTTTKNGQCVKEIQVKGNRVDDTFPFPCSSSPVNSHQSNDDFLLDGGEDTIKINSVYSKQPGKVQLIQDGKCSVRTYKISNGKTTVSSSPVGEAECDAMKKEHFDRLQKWKQWSAETFPPCYPFCGSEKTSAAKPKPLKAKPQTKPASAANQNPNTLSFKPFSVSGEPSSNVAQGSLAQTQNDSPLTSNILTNSNPSQNTPQGNNMVSNQSFRQFISEMLQSWIKTFSSRGQV